MYRITYTHTRQLIALLLMAVLVFVHITKLMHTHPAANAGHCCKQENVIEKAGPVHGACSICEFQPGKDASFTGEIQLVIAPVYTAPTYSRLLTSIITERLFIIEGRGPPRA